jgi:hypothetical protein
MNAGGCSPVSVDFTATRAAGVPSNTMRPPLRLESLHLAAPLGENACEAFAAGWQVIIVRHVWVAEPRAPSSPASATMPSPGRPHTVRYKRSATADSSARARRLPPVAAVAATVGAGFRTAPADPANARSIASWALR